MSSDSAVPSGPPEGRSVTITVDGDGEPHSLGLPAATWAQIVAGEALVVEWQGYSYEGEEFEEEWEFSGGLQGELEVWYDNGGVGWSGRLEHADIAWDANE